MIAKIFTVSAGNDTDGNTYKIDAIEHDGKLWLVPHWLESPIDRVSMPARIIRFDNQPHQHTPGSSFGDYVLNVPVPKALLDMASPKLPVSFEYEEMPDIRIPESVRPLHMDKGKPH